MDVNPAWGFRSRWPDATRSALALIGFQASKMSTVEPPSLPCRSRRTCFEYRDGDGHRIAQGQTAIALCVGVDLKPVGTRDHGCRERDLRLVAGSTVSGRHYLGSGIERPRRRAAEPVGVAADREVETSCLTCRQGFGPVGDPDSDR